MASKRSSVLAPNLLAKAGKAPARTTEIEDLPRSVDAPVEVMDRPASEPVPELTPTPEPALPPLPAPEFSLAPEPELTHPPEPKPEPVVETKPVVEANPEPAQKPGKGIKKATQGTTVYLIPDEAYRIKEVALKLRISLHDLILDGLDAILAKHGEAPINRYSKPRPKK